MKRFLLQYLQINHSLYSVLLMNERLVLVNFNKNMTLLHFTSLQLISTLFWYYGEKSLKCLWRDYYLNTCNLFHLFADFKKKRRFELANKRQTYTSIGVDNLFKIISNFLLLIFVNIDLKNN